MFQYEIYIPSEFETHIEHVASFFTIYYGGATIYQANGIWRNDINEPEEEAVTVVRSISTTDKDWPIQSMAEIIKAECKQSAILWTKQPIQSFLVTED